MAPDDGKSKGKTGEMGKWLKFIVGPVKKKGAGVG